MKPNIFHGPLPRMKPQPLHITGMITHRRAARERRLARFLVYNEQIRDIKREAIIERVLSKRKRFRFVFADATNEWSASPSLCGPPLL